jgi:hypothetical protein
VYLVNGVQITQSGRYVIPSSHGCDSIVKNVLVNESLVLAIDSVVSVCTTDDNIIIPFVEKSGKLLEFAIKFADEEMKDASVEAVKPENGAMIVPMLKGIEPNRYKATLSFGELACGGEDIDILLDVYYPDSIITQRWNDVLAVRNDSVNGYENHKFVAYQWYKNNEPIEGATSSILYETLDVNSTYSVMLTREDGVKEMVCAITPIKFDTENYNDKVVITQIPSSEVKVETSQSAQVRVWSTMGILVGEYFVNEGESVFSLTKDSRVYIFEFVFENGHRIVERVIL